MGSLVPEIVGGVIALGWLIDRQMIKSRLQHVQIEFDAKKSVHEYVLKAKESLIQKLERENFRLHEEAQRYKPDSDLLRAKLIEAENLKKEVLTLKEPIPQTKTIKASSAAEVRKLIEEQNFLEEQEKK